MFEQVAGNDNWTDFVNLAKYGNLSNHKTNDFSLMLYDSNSIFDIERFLRVLAVDILTTNVDSYETTGSYSYRIT